MENRGQAELTRLFRRSGMEFCEGIEIGDRPRLFEASAAFPSSRET